MIILWGTLYYYYSTEFENVFTMCRHCLGRARVLSSSAFQRERPILRAQSPTPAPRHSAPTGGHRRPHHRAAPSPRSASGPPAVRALTRSAAQRAARACARSARSVGQTYYKKRVVLPAVAPQTRAPPRAAPHPARRGSCPPQVPGARARGDRSPAIIMPATGAVRWSVRLYRMDSLQGALHAVAHASALA